MPNKSRHFYLMQYSNIRRLALFVLLSLIATACRAEVGLNGNVNAELGPTKMTRCALINGEITSYDQMVTALSKFADENDLKFLNSLPNGAYSSYLQIDDPYLIAKHSYFLQKDSPQHMLITYRPETDSRAELLEMALFDHLKKFEPLESCGNYESTITAGWRLKE